MKTLKDTLAIKVIPPGTTEGGIIIPDSLESARDLRTGLVVMVGPGIHTEAGNRIEPQVKPGDRVLFHNNHQEQGLKMKLNGEEFLMMPERAVIAILDEDDVLGF